jgi:hypothetical protein
MKINVDFNSLAELLNFSKTLANGLVPPEVAPKRDKNLPFAATSWQHAYVVTFANLQRAYMRIREFNELKKNNAVIRAEIEKIERKLEKQADKEDEEFLKDSIDNLLFTNRTANCLKAEKILRISKLINMTKNDLMKIPNFGKLSMKDVEETLKEHNLSLKGK